MSIKTLSVIAAVAASFTATAASAQAVTPQQVLALPVGTKYVGPATYDVALVRTAQGFNVVEKGKVVLVCNNVTKAGGRGNATINCATAKGVQGRFEWIDMKSVKTEMWTSMAAKAGQTQNKPADIKIILTRR